ncbi:extracellular solute-binding protein [Luteococcus sp. H91]
MIRRRQLLQAVGLAAAGSALTGCDSTPSTPGSSPSQSPSATSRSPEPVTNGTDVELWADDSRYPVSWAEQLSRLASEQTTALRTQVNSTSELAAALATRFSEGRPPSLVFNGGSDELSVGQLTQHLVDLTSLAGSASTAEGNTPIGSLLRPGTLAAGTVGKRLVAIPYVYTVHGLWYSAELFGEQGWRAPTSWPELMTLGERAQRDKRFLFCWGRDGATAYLRMALSMAAKQSGPEVLQALEHLEPKAWSQPAVQASLTAVQEAVRAGYVKPGGSQRSWRSAMAAWASDRSVLLVPCGSWIGAQIAPGNDFELSVAPDPVLDGKAKLPAAALHAGPDEGFLAPAAATNPEAGKALLRVALGRAAASHFAQTNQVIPTRTDALPAIPGPVLTQQLDLVRAAGEDVFSWRFISHHGTNHDHQVLWNSFLEGTMDVATLTRESQRISDLVAADPAQARL